MKKPFRSVEAWKSALMTLPDGPFFELLRSVFGNIKTPFNKQKLLEDLVVFLSRDDIRKIIGLYIDEADAAFIAAAALLGEPLPGEMEDFLAEDMSAGELQARMLNLEERFIICRFREEGLYRIALNPVLECVLSPFAVDSGVLFPSRSGEGGGSFPVTERPAALKGDCLIAGIVSFVLEEPCLLRPGRDQGKEGMRKKILAEANRVFPGMDMELLAGGLYMLELLRASGEQLFPDRERLGDFAKLSSRERLEYWAAGIYCFEPEAFGGPVSYLDRGRVRSIAGFFHRALGFIEEGTLYPLKTLRRRIFVLEREEPDTFPVRQGIHFERFLDALEKTGLIVKRGSSLFELASSADGREDAANGSGEKGSGAVLAMDAPFSWIAYPETAFADILDLAFFSAVRETGAALRFELTRDSAVRGFDRGISAEYMSGLLERLSGNRINGTLVWTLGDWEKRYGEVTLEEGIVLTLSQDRQYLTEAEPLKSFIRKTLAPGVYLLFEDAENASRAPARETETAAEALRRAGVDIIARGGAKAPVPFPQRVFFSSLKKEEALPAPENPRPSDPEDAAKRERAREEVKAGFRKSLEKLSLTREERAELLSRMERRLILCESQLDGASIRYEKLEARGLDYAGKANIARQAIASKSLVEVQWSSKGDSREVRGIPGAIEKKGGESILILDSAETPGEVLRIPLGKIGLLRRIKKSIFGE
ncbi:MAG: helicase-associated domain-containing protein [Treponema sp.]|jgi:hypothetical protein|nr:helicase-associated domain-containing protein [Treponema sp.]